MPTGPVEHTDPTGYYRFGGLTAGTYAVEETQPPEWLDGLDTTGTVGGVVVGAAVNPGDEIQTIQLRWGDQGVDYNFGELAPVAISGYVYHDRDDDGVRELGEEGIQGATVRVEPDATALPQLAKTVFTDPETGRTVWRMTDSPYHDKHAYYDVCPWSPDGTKICFSSARPEDIPEGAVPRQARQIESKRPQTPSRRRPRRLTTVPWILSGIAVIAIRAGRDAGGRIVIAPIVAVDVLHASAGMVVRRSARER